MIPRPARALPTWSLVVGAVLAWAIAGALTLRWGGRADFDLRIYRDAVQHLTGGHTYELHFSKAHLRFTYPPFALLVLSPLAILPVIPLELAWWVLDAAALVAFSYVALTGSTQFRGRRALVVATLLAGVAQCALEPLRSNADYGQINVFLMLLVVTDLTRVRPTWRGLLVGLAAAVKLTPLLYLAYFLVQRDLRSALRGGGAFIGAAALSWIILPTDSIYYWVHQVAQPQHTGNVNYVSNQSWLGLAHRAPFNAGHLGIALWCLLEAATLIAGIAAANRLVRLGRNVDALLALALTELLVSPISWSHHWSWLVLVPVVLIGRQQDHVRVSKAMLLVLVIAIAEPYWWNLSGWFGALADDSLVLAGAVLLASMTRAGGLPSRLSATNRQLTR
ncbi:MAG: glycosyltransferase 87 family protein [Acidimicrobiales bacterium]